MILSVVFALALLASPQASLLFNDAIPDKLESTATLVTNEPLTLAVWFYPTTLDSTDTVLSMSDSGGGIWRVGTAADDSFFAQKQSAGGATSGVSASAPATVTINTWTHLAAVFVTDTSRFGYLQGVAQTENTTNVGDSTPSHTNIGYLQCCGNTQADGRIAEAAIWNAALTAGEMATLAKGYAPNLVRPQSLVMYSPLKRAAQNLTTGLAWTVTGTAVADHPRMFYRRKGAR